MAGENRATILAAIDSPTKVMALIALVAEGLFLGSLAVIPSADTFWAMIVCAIILVFMIVGIAAVQIVESVMKRPRSGQEDIELDSDDSKSTSTDVQLSENWKTTFSEKQAGKNKVFHETVNLTRSGSKVTGTITFEEENELSKYFFEGSFMHNILTCTYRSTDPEDWERGAFALEYGKKVFEGYYVFRSKEKAGLKIKPSPYRWEAL